MRPRAVSCEPTRLIELGKHADNAGKMCHVAHAVDSGES